MPDVQRHVLTRDYPFRNLRYRAQIHIAFESVDRVAAVEA